MIALVTDHECFTCLQIQIVVAQLQEDSDLLQVAHEGCSTELRVVFMEVAGECLPNVVVSFEQLEHVLGVADINGLGCSFCHSQACKTKHSTACWR